MVSHIQQFMHALYEDKPAHCRRYQHQTPACKGGAFFPQDISQEQQARYDYIGFRQIITYTGKPAFQGHKHELNDAHRQKLQHGHIFSVFSFFL